MYPLQHLFFGTLLGIFLLILFPQIWLINFVIVILSSVLIDVDHYLWYVYKKKDWSLTNAYNWFIKIIKKSFSFPRKQRNEFYVGFCFLHGIEFLFVLSILGIFISRFFLFVFIGIAFHLLLDITDGTIYIDRIDKFSVICDFFKFKKLKYIENL